MRRVVITGLGVVAPNGIGKDEFWQANIEGKSGVDIVKAFDISDYEVKIAAEVKNFDPTKYVPEHIARKIDRFAQFGIVGAKMAIDDSGLNLNKEDTKRIGVSVGSGLGGVLFHEEQMMLMYKEGSKKAHPLGVSRVMPNAVTAHISIMLKLKGPNIAISTACSSGAHAIGQAFDLIKLDRADVMITGGTEAPITPFTFAAFTAMHVLSKRNDLPQEASRPFDRQRDGFVMGEGCGIVVLEELDHAKKRGAHIYAEILGYGLNSGAYHMVAPEPEGEDTVDTMTQALKESSLKPKEIDYINAHGTSTQANDKSETQAIKKLFGGYAYKIPISSTKSMIGHTIGAAGAIEAIVCCLVIENNLIPPTINYKYPDPDCDLDYVPNEARRCGVNAALSNSFGFGSNNATLIFRRF